MASGSAIGQGAEAASSVAVSVGVIFTEVVAGESFVDIGDGAVGDYVCLLLIMCPKPENLHYTLLFYDLIDKTMLDVYSS